MSKLVKIELINFMSLPHAVYEFDSRGIISPVGYNDSGKSALTRALEVLWFDAYPQQQAKFITDGQDSFAIRNFFDDGVVIQRIKYSSGSSHWLMTQGDKVVYTNQLANGSFSATKGVPDAIRAYLGVAQDEATGEILNVRRNTNKLLLIATTGGENYKIFNNLCQGERLACAVGQLNTDVNAKNRNLAAKTSRLYGKQETLSAMNVFDEATEAEILKKAGTLNAGCEKLRNLITLADRYNVFAGNSVIEPLPQIDTSRFEALTRLADIYKHASQEVISELPIIDFSRLEALTQLKTLSDACSGTVADEINLVDVDKYAALVRLDALLTEITDQNNEYKFKKEMYEVKRNELRVEARANNWRICQNCGEIVAEGQEVG